MTTTHDRAPRISDAAGPHGTACPPPAHEHGESCSTTCPTCNTFRHGSPPAAPVELLPAEHAADVCPCCGSYVAASLGISSPLLAVCDVLVVRALEAVGKRLVRAERSRFRTLGTRPWHEAHTVWQPAEDTLAKTLTSAWDVVPALLDTHGCCGITARQTTAMLDEYVRDLIITGTRHTFAELRYRFTDRLGIPVPAAHPAGGPS